MLVEYFCSESWPLGAVGLTYSKRHARIYSQDYLPFRFPIHNVMSLGTIMITLAFLVIPFCKSMGALALVLAIMGFYMGIIDTTTNVSMIRLYGLDVSPFLQVSTVSFSSKRLGVRAGMVSGSTFFLRPGSVFESNDRRTVSAKLRLHQID